MFNIPEDKLGHINLGLLLGLAFADFIGIAIIVVCGVAFGKEIYDFLSTKYFKANHSVEMMDAVATIGGGYVGIVLHYFIGFVIKALT